MLLDPAELTLVLSVTLCGSFCGVLYVWLPLWERIRQVCLTSCEVRWGLSDLERVDLSLAKEVWILESDNGLLASDVFEDATESGLLSSVLGCLAGVEERESASN